MAEWKNPDAGNGYNFNSNMFGGGIGQFLGGMFGNSGAPYDKAANEYQKWANNATATNAPFYGAGAGAIPAYQQWLQGQKDPSQFINSLMGNYSESQGAHNKQQAMMNAGNNYGSANGLSGSSALAQQMQQNAGQISSEDMNQWLQNVLGINNQYGEGQQHLMNMGQNSANSLTNLYNSMGERMGNAAFGKEAGRQQDKGDMWGGAFNMLGGLFGL